MKLIVTKMYWERVILNINGRIDIERVKGEQEGALEEYAFYLVEEKTNEIVPLKYAKVIENHFELRLDFFRAYDLFPMPNGTWKLYYTKKNLSGSKNTAQELVNNRAEIKIDTSACGFSQDSFIPLEFGESFYPYYKWTDKYAARISKIFRYRRYEYIINIAEVAGDVNTLTFKIMYDGKGYRSNSQYKEYKKVTEEKKQQTIEDARLVWEQFKVEHPDLFDIEEVVEEEKVNPAVDFMVHIYRRVSKKVNGFITMIKTHVYRAFFFVFSRLINKDGTNIVFTSDSRESLSGNMECIYNRLVERGLDKKYNLHFIFKASVRDRRKLRDKFRFTYDIAKADYIIIDDYHPLLYKVSFPKSTTIIQVWHASGAFKTVGYSRIGKPGGPSPFAKQHKNYTYALVSSDYDVPFYAEAFGIDESHVIPTGIPRMDYFFDEEYQKSTIEKMYNEFPSCRGKRVIMFAPTFRGSGPRVAYYDVERIDYPALAEYCRKSNSIIVFKMHPFVIEPLEIPKEYSDCFIDATEYREINDILFISDLVITDYSSLIFEYATLNRPMIFYAYDLEKYISKRDFYFEFRSFVPGKIVETSEELLMSLENEDFEIEKIERFRKEHFKYFDNCSTDRVIDNLLNKTISKNKNDSTD